MDLAVQQRGISFGIRGRSGRARRGRFAAAAIGLATREVLVLCRGESHHAEAEGAPIQ